VIVAYRQVNNSSAIPWREQVKLISKWCCLVCSRRTHLVGIRTGECIASIDSHMLFNNQYCSNVFKMMCCVFYCRRKPCSDFENWLMIILIDCHYFKVFPHFPWYYNLHTDTYLISELQFSLWSMFIIYLHNPSRLNLHSNTPMNGYWSSDIK
jgi:hypothetical protein